MVGSVVVVVAVMVVVVVVRLLQAHRLLQSHCSPSPLSVTTSPPTTLHPPPITLRHIPSHRPLQLHLLQLHPFISNYTPSWSPPITPPFQSQPISSIRHVLRSHLLLQLQHFTIALSNHVTATEEKKVTIWGTRLPHRKRGTGCPWKATQMCSTPS